MVIGVIKVLKNVNSGMMGIQVIFTHCFYYLYFKKLIGTLCDGVWGKTIAMT